MTRIIVLPGFLFFFLLFSCGPKSKKGAWIKSEKKQCISEGVEALSKDPNFSMIQVFLKSYNEKEFATCVCDKLEKKYDSYAEADKKITKNLDQDAAFDLVKDCLGSEFKDLMENLEDLKNLGNPEDLDNSNNTEQ